jgi:hypothetical protein
MQAFISYAKDDERFASALRSCVEDHGVSVFDAARDISPGERFADKLHRAIEGSDVLILVVPKLGASQANTAIFEAGAAKALGKTVLAVSPDLAQRELPFSVTNLAFNASDKSIQDLTNAMLGALQTH